MSAWPSMPPGVWQSEQPEIWMRYLPRWICASSACAPPATVASMSAMIKLLQRAFMSNLRRSASLSVLPKRSILLNQGAVRDFAIIRRSCYLAAKVAVDGQRGHDYEKSGRSHIESGCGERL